jgi:ACS family D-galactonate transporter-like MFS transporter
MNTQTHAPAAAPSLLPRAWLTVGLLWPVALLNYLDRQMLATMRLSMQSDIIDLQSAENFGRLMAIFMWVYALCSPLGGMVADRFSRKWLVVGSLFVWSAVTLLMGYATDFKSLYWLRAFMGVSEALYIPAGLALLVDFHPGPTRSLAVGLHMSGLYFGQALGGVGGWIAQDLSWRAAFSWCGTFGVAYALVLAWLLREARPATGAERPGGAAPTGVGTPDWVGFALLTLCFTLPSLPGWAVKNWMPTLLQDRFGFDQKTSGLLATTSTSLAGLCGVILGGKLSDLWARRGPRGRTRVSTLGLLLLVPALAGMGLAPGPALVTVCAVLYGFGFGLFDANNMPILCQFLPARLRATGYGLLNFVGIAVGAWLTPLLGRLKDHGVPLAQGFSLTAAPALLAALLMWRLRPVQQDCGAK